MSKRLMIIIHKVGWNDCLVMKYDLFKKRFLIQVNDFFLMIKSSESIKI